METETQEAIEKRIAQLCDDARKRAMQSGKQKDEATMHRAIAKKVMAEYSPEEFIALVMPTVKRKLKNNMKVHGWAAALTKGGQQDAFPEGLEDAAISINGTAVSFGAAESPIFKQVIRAQIDNDIVQKKSYTRKMDTLLPLDSLMEEHGITAAEAIEIMRKRDK